MEAYFHSDSRIEEWVNLITEKIFTVCLLTGNESEAEFQKGCQIVTNVTQLLQGISIFPSESLEEGLKQLLEQQLPDSRVINNFPNFQDTMNRMLLEGISRAIETQNKENMKSLAISDRNTPENIQDDVKESYKVHDDVTEERLINALDDEVVIEQAITVLASVNSMTPVIASTSEQADRLKHVLSNIFPNVTVCWNLELMGQSFLAQVEDILICLQNPEQPCPVENLNKEGWKVYLCSSNDLMFPHRLERGIRQIKRLKKSSAKTDNISCFSTTVVGNITSLSNYLKRDTKRDKLRI